MGKLEDLTGQKFGNLTVLYMDEPHRTKSGTRLVKWVCKCDCGNYVSVFASSLKSGNTKSCGCLLQDDLTGKRFGKLVVLQKCAYRNHGHVVYTCKCDCGNTKDICGSNLLNGNTKSCGCSIIGNTFRRKDLTGLRFGKLLVLEYSGKSKGNLAMWKCQCDCGSTVIVRGNDLQNGKQVSCGCARYDKPQYNFEDLTGKKFNRLLVLNREENEKNGRVRWRCRCDCGNITMVDTYNLKSGNVKSCGCYSIDISTERLTRHGLCYTRLYGIWSNMKSRCYNKRASHYEYYGGRGIGICDEWKEDFQTFYDWAMSKGYRDDLSIDRINNDGNYEPSNCRWVNNIEQANNKRNNVSINIDGESHTIPEWSRITGINQGTIYGRIKNGWPLDKLLEPINRK